MYETLNEDGQGLAVQFEGAALGRPGELEAAHEGRHPDLPDRGVRAHDEPRFCWLLEEDVEDASLELDLELLAVGQVHQPALKRLEGLVGFCGELLVRERQ